MINRIKKFLLNFNSREKKNLVSSLSNISLQTFAQILYPPLMIFSWGANLFGSWIFLISIPSIFLLFNIQFNDAAIQEITIYKAKNNINKANEYFSSSIIFILLNLIIFNSIFFLYLINFENNFEVLRYLDNEELKIIILLLVISINLKVVEGIFHTGIYSYGKLNIVDNISTILDFSSKILIVFFGFFFNNLIYAASIIIFMSVISIILHIHYFVKVNEVLKISLNKISKKIVKKIFILSIGHNSEKIGFILKQAGIIIVTGKYFDAYTVAFISTLFTLFYYFPKRLFGRFSNIYIFEYANLFGKKKITKLKNKLKFFLKYNLIGIIIFTFVSLSIGPYLYKFWLNNNYTIIYSLLFIIVLDSFFEVIKISFFTIFKSLNNFVLLGFLDMLISSSAFLLFYLLLELKIFNTFFESYIVILFGNFVCLLISLIYFFYFYQSNFKKRIIF